MYTNMTGIRWLSKNLCILVLWTKVASELEGLKELKKNLKLLSIKKILYLKDVKCKTVEHTMYASVYI